MSIENLTFPLITQHNAEYTREIQAAKEVSRLLQLVDFPGDDVWVDLRFDYMLSDHSVSAVDVLLIRGKPHGIVKLSLQGLFLMQDFTSMLLEVIPHELAHVLHAIDSKVEDYSIQKPHDDSWMDFFDRLADSMEVSPSAKVKGNFDDRAVRLARGGLLVECECGGDEGICVIADTAANSAKLRTEELNCSRCKHPFVRATGAASMPASVAKDLAFLENIKCIKLQHTNLQR